MEGNKAPDRHGGLQDMGRCRFSTSGEHPGVPPQSFPVQPPPVYSLPEPSAAPAPCAGLPVGGIVLRIASGSATGTPGQVRGLELLLEMEGVVGAFPGLDSPVQDGISSGHLL